MLQAGNRPRLAKKSLPTLRVGRRRRREHLHGDSAPERVLDRLVNDPHPPATDLADHPIRAEPEFLRVGLGRTSEFAPASFEEPDRGQDGTQFLGAFGVKRNIFLNRRALAATATVGELLGDEVDRVSVGPFRGGEHDCLDPRRLYRLHPITHARSLLKRNQVTSVEWPSNPGICSRIKRSLPSART